jgi:hypothetical protein
MAFIDTAITRGLGPEAITEAIIRDPALAEAASKAVTEDMLKGDPDPPPIVSTEGELLDFLRRRGSTT